MSVSFLARPLITMQKAKGMGEPVKLSDGYVFYDGDSVVHCGFLGQVSGIEARPTQFALYDEICAAGTEKKPMFIKTAAEDLIELAYKFDALGGTTTVTMEMAGGMLTFTTETGDMVTHTLPGEIIATGVGTYKKMTEDTDDTELVVIDGVNVKVRPNGCMRATLMKPLRVNVGVYFSKPDPDLFVSFCKLLKESKGAESDKKTQGGDPPPPPPIAADTSPEENTPEENTPEENTPEENTPEDTSTPPEAPKKRVRRSKAEVLQERLEKAEELLKDNGYDVTKLEMPEEDGEVSVTDLSEKISGTMVKLLTQVADHCSRMKEDFDALMALVDSQPASEEAIAEAAAKLAQEKFEEMLATFKSS